MCINFFSSDENIDPKSWPKCHIDISCLLHDKSHEKHDNSFWQNTLQSDAMNMRVSSDDRNKMKKLWNFRSKTNFGDSTFSLTNIYQIQKLDLIGTLKTVSMGSTFCSTANCCGVFHLMIVQILFGWHVQIFGQQLMDAHFVASACHCCQHQNLAPKGKQLRSEKKKQKLQDEIDESLLSSNGLLGQSLPDLKVHSWSRKNFRHGVMDWPSSWHGFSNEASFEILGVAC